MTLVKCNCHHILISTGTGTSNFSQLQAFYEGLGYTVDFDSGPGAFTPSNLNDYHLLMFLFPESPTDPSWWATVAAGNWAGRVLLSAESNAVVSGTAAIAYVNGKSGTTGIAVNSTSLDSGVNAGSVESDPLTSGVSNIYYGLTTTVSGGTTLSKTVTGSIPWLAHNKVGNIDFVVSGDTSFAVDSVFPGRNEQFFQNLLDVPV